MTKQVNKQAGKIEKSEQEWQQELDPVTYSICRAGGTERAFTGKYWDLKDSGIYRCAACGEKLFTSETKYDSGSGWPSFYQPVSQESVEEIADTSLGMLRTEVVCAKCESHLGHVFPDGPPQTGLRYCINSASLNFDKADTTGQGEEAGTE